jgi:phosphoglycolate phosphatase
VNSRAKIEAVAIDFDRTLTDESFKVSEKVKDFLVEAKKDLVIIIASGRTFDFFKENDLLDIGHVFVLENGALIFINGRFVTTPMSPGDASGKIKGALTEKNIPFDSGRVVISVKRVHEESVKKIVEGMDVRLEYNVDDIMVLPSGMDKGMGVVRAMSLMGLNGGLAAVGDAENDVKLFEVADLKGAVANAIPELKGRADFVSKKPHGEGVMEFIEFITTL